MGFGCRKSAVPRDFRIRRADVALADDDAFFWALIEPTWPATEAEDCPEHLAQATPGQRALYTTMLFARDVDNGGLEQVLWNLPAWLIESAEAAFLLLDARQHAVALRQGIEAFFGNSPPGDLQSRRPVVESKDRQWLVEVIEPLNEQLYGERRLWPYWKNYVDSHGAEFFVD